MSIVTKGVKPRKPLLLRSTSENGCTPRSLPLSTAGGEDRARRPGMSERPNYFSYLDTQSPDEMSGDHFRGMGRSDPPTAAANIPALQEERKHVKYKDSKEPVLLTECLHVKHVQGSFLTGCGS